MNTLLIQRGMKPDYLPEIASPARASRDARRAAASAFTLVELLAVLAIIGILSAIIIPTVSKVRESARNAQCISNLRQIGAGLMLYAEDHKGRITGSRYNDPGDGNNYPLWCYRLGRGGYISKSDTNGNSPVFACPLIPKKGTGSMPEENKYGMRVWAPDNTQPSIEEDRLLPLSAIETPSDFFLVADSINNSTNIQWYCLTPDGSTVKGIHLRHNNKANAVFADGHVAAKDRDYFAQLHTRQLHNGSTNRNKSFTIYPAR